MPDIIHKIVECEKNAQKIVAEAQEKQELMLQRLDVVLKHTHDEAIAQADAEFAKSREKSTQEFHQQEVQMDEQHNRQLIGLKKIFDEKRTECIHEIVERILSENR